MRRTESASGGLAASAVLALALGVLVPGIAFAQLTTGTIEGTVRDATGAALPGATVEVSNVDTDVTRTLVTDAQGRYSAPNLSVGAYEVVATLQGFARARSRGITVTVGRRAIVDVSMGLAGQTEEVVVEAAPPLIATKEATVSYLVGEREVSELPVINRDLTQLAFLQPGVLKSPAGQGVFSGQGDKLAVAGARGTQNLYMLDGVANGDLSGNPQGSSGVYNGSETIQEMQIITNNYSAEYRSAVGAIVSAITKSGTNTVHGSAFGYFRDDALDAQNFFDKEFDNPKPDFSRQHFGATLGGPISKGKLFFFASYEGIREDLGFTDTAIVPSLGIRNGVLANGTVVNVHPTSARIVNLYPTPGDGNSVVDDFGDSVLIAGTARRETTNDFFVGKLDWDPDSINRLSVTFNYDKGSRDRRGLVISDSQTAGQASKTQIISGKWTSQRGSNAVNEFHLGFSDTTPEGDIPLSDVDWVAEGLIFRVDRTLVGEIVTDVWDDFGFRVDRSSFNQKSFTAKDMFTLNTGRHELRFGGEFTHYNYDVFTCSRGCNGTYEFRSVRDFLIGRARRLEVLVPGGDITDKSLSQNVAGVFAQDNWQVTPNLTLNLGLRYEHATRIEEKSGNTAQLIRLTDQDTTVGPFYKPLGGVLSPRLGFAYAPDDGRWSLRGGFGLFYEHPNLFLIRTALAELPPFTLVGRIEGNVDYPNAGFTQLGEARGRPNVRAFDFDLKQTSSLRYSLTYQKQIGQDYVATLDYTGARGRNLWHQNQANLCRWEGFSLDADAFPSPVTGTKQFPEECEPINPGFGAIRLQNANAKSWFNGLGVGFNRIARNGLRFGLSYTFSKSIDQGSGVTSGGEELPQSQRGIYGYDLQLKQGLSAFDRRHQFVANLAWEVPIGKDATGAAAVLLKGWQINGIVSFLSGYPLTVLELSDDQIDRIGDDEDLRPSLVPGGDNNPVTGNADQWFDVTQFVPSTPGQFGDVGRNTITAPDLFSVDLSLLKNVGIGRGFLQFRIEAFNLFDRTNLGQPDMVVFRDGELNDTAGRITSTATPARRVQLGVRWVF